MSRRSFKARCVKADPSHWVEEGETYDCTEMKGVVLVRVRNRPVAAFEEEEFYKRFEV